MVGNALSSPCNGGNWGNWGNGAKTHPKYTIYFLNSWNIHYLFRKWSRQPHTHTKEKKHNNIDLLSPLSSGVQCVQCDPNRLPGIYQQPIYESIYIWNAYTRARGTHKQTHNTSNNQTHIFIFPSSFLCSIHFFFACAGGVVHENLNFTSHSNYYRLLCVAWMDTQMFRIYWWAWVLF